jgi:polysaccharide deacetylase 2 family uncharacterized protein YibQ
MEISDVPIGRLPPYRRMARLLYVILGALAIMASIGLDYVNSREGKTSYIFGKVKEKKQAPPPVGTPIQEALDESLIAFLKGQGLPSGSLQKYRDENGLFHVRVNLTQDDYPRFESLMEKWLKKEGASVTQKEEQQDKEKSYFLWQVEKAKDKGVVLFSCLKETPAKEEAPPRKEKSKVALIVDDMGNSLDILTELCALKRPLTISILPFSKYAKETAEIAHQNGLEVMLHLPLESMNNQEADSQAEGIIYSWASEDDIKRILESDLGQVPYIRGVNNHMGSKVTADAPIMRIILAQLKAKGLFFIDSRTSGKSLAYDLAQEMGIPSSFRQVFLDAANDRSSIKDRMKELFGLAQKRGRALGICHPLEETIVALKKNIGLVERYNLELIFASQIVHR